MIKNGPVVIAVPNRTEEALAKLPKHDNAIPLAAPDDIPPLPTAITEDEHAYFAKAFADLEAAEKQAMEANAALRDAGAAYLRYGRHLSEKYGLVAGRDEINAPSGAIIYGKNSTP